MLDEIDGRNLERKEERRKERKKMNIFETFRFGFLQLIKVSGSTCIRVMLALK